MSSKIVQIEIVRQKKKNDTDVVDGGEQVEVVFVSSDGKVEKREVVTGLQDAEYVEILSGLKKGEKIVVYPYMAISKSLEDGSKVEETTKSKVFAR